jgi:hypothetical protein
MQPQNDSNPQGREIRDVALLDLTGAQASAALDGITCIRHVATILVPESLLAKLSSIPMEHVAATVPVPDGARAKSMTGEITLSGEALANVGGKSEDVLIVIGKLILTSPVKQVGYSDVILIGAAFAPTGSETALGAGLRRMTGRLAYYPYTEGANVRVLSSGAISAEALANASGEPTDVLLASGHLVVTSPIQRVGFQRVIAFGPLVVPKDTDPAQLERITTLSGQVVFYTAPPRVFDGKDHFSAAFFELFEAPITLVLHGKYTFDEDVDPGLLREKVAGIVLDGKLVAPRRLVPTLQMLCVVREGTIQASDEAE